MFTQGIILLEFYNHIPWGCISANILAFINLTFTIYQLLLVLCEHHYRNLVNYEVKGNSPHKTTHTSDTSCKLGIPKNTHRLKNSLEGMTELTESSYTHGYDYSLLQGKDTD